MNETEIRGDLRTAIGEPRYPSSLKSMVESRLQRPQRARYPRGLAVIAAALAILIVATLVLVRVHISGFGPLLPGVQPPPSTNAHRTTAARQVPLFDLQGAGLSAAATVIGTPDLVATDHGRTVRLLGAYADTAMLALIFRTLPEAQPRVEVSDGQGWINAGSGWSNGSFGDSIFILFASPHAGSDGIAHLKISITSLDPIPPSSEASVSGNWSFALDLKVQPAVALIVPASLTSTWKVTVQAFELTPAAIHLMAIFAGANPLDAQQPILLVDDQGNAMPPSGFIGPASPGVMTSTRVDFTWPRPNRAAVYRLEVRGGGAEEIIPIYIPAPPPVTGKGVPLTPTDFPAAHESLSIAGAWGVSIAEGHPQSCGAGAGAGPVLYSFATYFQPEPGASQVDSSLSQWDYLALTTNTGGQSYRGPGTYAALATISPLGSNGPAAPIFSGQVQLTVKSDSGLETGTVNGTLRWVDDPTKTIILSGSWSCRFGPQLGPG